METFKFAPGLSGPSPDGLAKNVGLAVLAVRENMHRLVLDFQLYSIYLGTWSWVYRVDCLGTW